MKLKRPLILISNDDGYHSKGLKMSDRYDIAVCDLLVVALSSNSVRAFSMAFSVTLPLRVEVAP